MRRALVFALDVLIVISAAIATAILVSGGGVFAWHSSLLRVARARNSLWAVFALTLLRSAVGRGMPFLARWPLQPWTQAAARVTDRATDHLAGLTRSAGDRLVFGILVMSALMKIWNAYH